MFVTSDAATIIREIEVAHPAAKLLVMASNAQESEVGPVSFGYIHVVSPGTRDPVLIIGHTRPLPYSAQFRPCPQ